MLSVVQICEDPTRTRAKCLTAYVGKKSNSIPHTFIFLTYFNFAFGVTQSLIKKRTLNPFYYQKYCFDSKIVPLFDKTLPQEW